MEKLSLYRVENHYVNYLQSRDNKVQNNKNRRRPYVGIVLVVDQYRYFVPMESPKPNHANIKNGKHIFKIDGGRYGFLGFNNMIPVPDSALISFDIDSEPDEAYADLLRRQVRIINESKADILDRASRTYYDVVNNKNKFLVSISCNFKSLESAYNNYDPNHYLRKLARNGKA